MFHWKNESRKIISTVTWNAPSTSRLCVSSCRKPMQVMVDPRLIPLCSSNSNWSCFFEDIRSERLLMRHTAFNRLFHCATQLSCGILTEGDRKSTRLNSSHEW